MDRYMGRALAACALVVFTGLLTFGFAAGRQESLVGIISDTMCGAKHPGGVSAADCTRSCVNQGSKFALVVGDKVYTLEGGDKATLDKLAGEKAAVTGTVEGKTIQVKSVSAAKL